ncbi:luciferase family oxidoreductase, group 1 [Streptomyces sp. DvalAA-14]|uniref:LLM class flavin-dependent oxidoreductase n=1 Tax=unclassified Streptomyces TaxID=2593676 RepID=UPI00081B7FE7|nr:MULTISPECIES: LLM class flavin-dependent oxidoreductase [unclassified Streptomyces]MYS23030.1 LLM class flavin-dependent oxidoreductase [Streptomyces sp. SID4948]SCE26348.1 luciferase family oxidoreductase, group 1 [Streptomyces sp. DvalAA-14]
MSAPTAAGRPAVPLSILDLSPIPSGSTPAQALRNTVDLAQRAEAAGYARYWLAEHHLATGVAGVSPALVIQLVAAATERIRVGAGAVQLGHRTALSVVEEFGLLDALFPGRIDLGLGRSGFPQRKPAAGGGGGAPAAKAPAPTPTPTPTKEEYTTPEGLLIPAPFDISSLIGSPLLARYIQLVQQQGAEPADYREQVEQIQGLIRGDFRTRDGLEAHALPGEGADLQLWVLGSSGGISARTAGALGLPFGANYHVSPAAILEAVEAYRKAFVPSAALAAPHVLVSADVVVAEDDATARHLASPYGLWVHSIRSGRGAIPFPAPREAAAHEWTAQERGLVEDRVRTQFAGSPQTVVDRLRVLQRATGADELLVTTITHDHQDRVRSLELLARAWR